jgi:hypothetical protein
MNEKPTEKVYVEFSPLTQIVHTKKSEIGLGLTIGKQYLVVDPHPMNGKLDEAKIKIINNLGKEILVDEVWFHRVGKGLGGKEFKFDIPKLSHKLDLVDIFIKHNHELIEKEPLTEEILNPATLCCAGIISLEQFRTLEKDPTCTLSIHDGLIYINGDSTG